MGGTLDKIQRRWFVLKGNYMTYFKTNVHAEPKSDKCVDLTDFKINPVAHPRSKFAFELISPPKPKKKSKSHRLHRHRDQVQGSPYNHHQGQVERTKFVLIHDLEARTDSKQREIRDKWVKSLRLAAKGPVLWDVLLNLNCNEDIDTHHGTHDYGQGHSKHSQTAFTTSTTGKLYAERGHSHYGNGGHSPNAGPQRAHTARAARHSAISHRSTGAKPRAHRPVGGNTADYPDYSRGKRLSGHPQIAKMTPNNGSKSVNSMY